LRRPAALQKENATVLNYSEWTRGSAGAGYLAAIGVLEREHPAGVFQRQRADLIELLDLFGREFEIGGSQIVFQLLQTLGFR